MRALISGPGLSEKAPKGKSTRVLFNGGCFLGAFSPLWVLFGPAGCFFAPKEGGKKHPLLQKKSTQGMRPLISCYVVGCVAFNKLCS